MTDSYAAAIALTSWHESPISVPPWSALQPPNDGTTSPPIARRAAISDRYRPVASAWSRSPFHASVHDVRAPGVFFGPLYTRRPRTTVAGCPPPRPPPRPRYGGGGPAPGGGDGQGGAGRPARAGPPPRRIRHRHDRP